MITQLLPTNVFLKRTEFSTVPLIILPLAIRLFLTTAPGLYFAGGKSPEQFNYISIRGTRFLEKRFRALMWAELHEVMDENKHLHGVEFKETVFTFMKRYSIASIQEDGLLKNYQRWRDSFRRKTKRAYNRKKM